eukprot:1958001-Prymnesium_polylepis.1
MNAAESLPPPTAQPRPSLIESSERSKRAWRTASRREQQMKSALSTLVTSARVREVKPRAAGEGARNSTRDPEFLSSSWRGSSVRALSERLRSRFFFAKFDFRWSHSLTRAVGAFFLFLISQWTLRPVTSAIRSTTSFISPMV